MYIATREYDIASNTVKSVNQGRNMFDFAINFKKKLIGLHKIRKIKCMYYKKKRHQEGNDKKNDNSNIKKRLPIPNRNKSEPKAKGKNKRKGKGKKDIVRSKNIQLMFQAVNTNKENNCRQDPEQVWDLSWIKTNSRNIHKCDKVYKANINQHDWPSKVRRLIFGFCKSEEKSMSIYVKLYILAYFSWGQEDVCESELKCQHIGQICNEIKCINYICKDCKCYHGKK